MTETTSYRYEFFKTVWLEAAAAHMLKYKIQEQNMSKMP